MPAFDQLIKTEGLVKRAYEFARRAHAGQRRKSGEPYINHPLAAAKTIHEWGLDETIIAATLLHDVTEDTAKTSDDIKKEFGEEIAFLVEGVSKIGHVKYRGLEARVENMRKFILAIAEDLRVVLIKLADRLHNMKTLAALRPEKQKRIALETMEIYAPLAYRLGMTRLSGELEDLAFPYIYPREYAWLTSTMKEKYEARARYAEKLKPIIEAELKKHNVPVVSLDSRAKRYTSLYKKLLRYNMDIEQIYDLVATRVIVPSIADCYAALGVIHKTYPPLPKRFKDYIALPKPNGYRSLHTTVFGPENKITEIQIRTPEIHEEAELGIVAYQEYKGSGNYLKRRASFADKKEMAWIGQLKNWQKHAADSDEFIQSLKIDFFKDRILAITPKGEVIDLPAGATPIDFGYAIHSAVGGSATGARVNGKIFPLNGELKSGDMVEIITQKNKRPSESWLEFVRTSTAKNHIKTALRSKNGSLGNAVPLKIEMKLTITPAPGLINSISGAITRSHLHIESINTPQHDLSGGLQLIKINLPMTPKDKMDKLVGKLKAIKEIREVVYRFI
jgi:GTP pyrophosphokinase